MHACMERGVERKVKNEYKNFYFFSFPFQPFSSTTNSSTLRYGPRPADHGQRLTCRVDNPDLADSAIEDSMELEIHCEY